MGDIRSLKQDGTSKRRHCLLSLDDKRWTELIGGTGSVGSTQLLLNLESRTDNSRDISRIYGKDFFHQGDVGEASYAAVFRIWYEFIKIARKIDWNTYAIVASIELLECWEEP